MITFRILGEPKAQQSFRVRGFMGPNGKPFAQKYQAKDAKENQGNIRAQIAQQLPAGWVPIQGPVWIRRALFIFAATKDIEKIARKNIRNSFNDPPFFYEPRTSMECQDIPILKITKPDLGDNLMKGLLDAMSGVVYQDDKQVCFIQNSIKAYGPIPMTLIELGFGFVQELFQAIEPLTREEK